ncbi:diheme cytochrome c [Thiohalomonas denitrificans]|uniref:Dihaem cytochrome c n=1 Tax=Thiohalomonas denitrificans TaxID=415747 RepID=A0A1G5PK91_9GAMM|nr:diheme cytochrome c [Thiohalomonas denitrificans]SCZ49943.1 Dihaem cytochrome c [Thiohalomonas denitrificans]
MDGPMMTVGAVVIGLLGLFAFSGMVQSDENDYRERQSEEYEQGRDRGFFSWGKSTPGVVPVDNELYQSECGACHMAYQPGLLPARSWERLMEGLADHFGDNAELPPDLHQKLLAYMVANSAEKSDAKRSRRFSRSIAPDERPISIVETRYFFAKHDEVPRRLVEDNPEVRSFSNCGACHRGAEKGIYDDDSIVIPGYGRVD